MKQRLILVFIISALLLGLLLVLNLVLGSMHIPLSEMKGILLGEEGVNLVFSNIVLRGEGRTPMPDKEQLHKLAQSQSTMCIYLSASIVEKVERDLLTHYPKETPVAVCYKLTWKDEKIYRCTLETLARTVRENNLKMTTMIVVGKAIDNRQGLSKLYDGRFAHAFRDTLQRK